MPDYGCMISRTAVLLSPDVSRCLGLLDHEKLCERGDPDARTSSLLICLSAKLDFLVDADVWDRLEAAPFSRYSAIVRPGYHAPRDLLGAVHPMHSTKQICAGTRPLATGTPRGRRCQL